MTRTPHGTGRVFRPVSDAFAGQHADAGASDWT